VYTSHTQKKKSLNKKKTQHGKVFPHD